MDGIQEGLNIGASFGVIGLCELAGGIDGDKDYCKQDCQDTDNDKKFNQCETFS